MEEYKEEVPLLKQYKEACAQFQKTIDDLENELEEKDRKINDLSAQIGDKSRIVISRLWHQPEIKVEYNYHGVRISMTSEDFIKSVINQVLIDNQPTGIKKWVNIHFPSKETLEKWMLDVVDRIEGEMKQATVYFSPPSIPK